MAVPFDCEETDIAVVGMAGRFPGADNLSEFWSNLLDKVESIRQFTRDELVSAGVSPSLLDDPHYVPAAPESPNLAAFAAGFFRIPPREARRMDPQQRLFLECAWEAFEDAGYNPHSCRRPIGLYGGSGYNAYLEAAGGFPDLGADFLTGLVGSDKDFLTTRVAHLLDLRGPVVTVQTACSTGLVAVHLACQGLLTGECDMALAGAASVWRLKAQGYSYQEGGIVSADGHCRAFDANAGGTLFGNGAGVVVLKRATEALADGDDIRALIKGSAVNNDGARKAGFTTTSVEGQAEVIGEALAVAGVDPSTVQHVETHGTGTATGDVIEVAGLTKAFHCDSRSGEFCGLGSVKTNIGHMGAASGIAGFIKAVLSLQNAQLPGTVHFQRPNPEISFADSPFYVIEDTRSWEGKSQPRRAGVNSLGIGGTNAHVILEQAPALDPLPVSRHSHLLTLSAETVDALAETRRRMAEHLRAKPDLELADVAFTTNIGRRRHAKRQAIVCRDLQEALVSLDKEDHPAGQHPEIPQARSIRFLCPDDSVDVASLRVYHESEPEFRSVWNECAKKLERLSEVDLSDFPDLSGRQSEILLLTGQYSIGQVLLKWGLTPESILGQGIGRRSSACLSGMIDFETAIELLQSGREDLEATLASLDVQPARFPCLCRESGEALTPEKMREVDFWKVRTATAQEAQISANSEPASQTIDIQLGPLDISCRECESCSESLAAPGLERSAFSSLLARLWSAGVEIDWRAFHAREKRRRVSLPTTVLERGRYWFDETPAAGEPLSSSPSSGTHHPLLGTPLGEEEESLLFESRLSRNQPACLADHIVFDRCILPTAACLEMAMATAIRSNWPAPVSVENLSLRLPLELSAEPVVVRTTLRAVTSGERSFSVERAEKGEGESAEFVSCVAGTIRAGSEIEPGQATLDPEKLAQDSASSIDIPAFYEELAGKGLHFGSRFRSLTRLWRKPLEALGLVELPSELHGEAGDYHLHPVLLDGCLQVVGAVLPADGPLYLPIAIDRFQCCSRPGDRLYSKARRRVGGDSSDTLVFDLTLYGPEGRQVGHVKGLAVRPAAPEMFAGRRSPLPDWFLRVGWREAALPASSSDSSDAESEEKELHALPARLRCLAEQNNMESYDQFARDLDHLSVSYAVAALTRLGCEWERKDPVSIAELLEQLSISQKHHRLFARLLAMLAEEQHVTMEGETLRFSGIPATEAVEVLACRLLARSSEEPAEFQLLRRSGDHLAELLRGERDPLEVLFADGSLQTAMQLYEKSPLFQTLNGLMAEAAPVCLRAALKNRRLRVLEVGAGTGGTTAHILPGLQGQIEEYVFTDLSPLFLTAAKEKFKSFAFLRHAILDIEKDPVEQGFPENHYDLVIAANVLHATADLEITLQNVRRLLAPEGTLLLLEATAPERWVDLVFGLTDGWWKFDDTHLRPDYPLLERAAWEELLKRVGFEPVAEAVADSENFRALSKHVLIAARPAETVEKSGAAAWLLITDTSTGIGKQLNSLVVSNGERTIIAEPAERFERLGENSYRLPLDAEGLQRLWKKAFSSGTPCRGIVHLLPATAEWDGSNWALSQEIVCRSTLRLVQALSKVGVSPPLFLVSRGAQAVDNEPVKVSQSTLWGMGRTIVSEYPQLRCRLIDLDPAAEIADCTGHLLEELSNSHDEPEVAWRFNRRYVPRLARTDPPTEAFTFPQEGTCLITGGHGGLGREVADWMVRQGVRHLVLCGRSEPDASLQKRLDAWRDAGANVAAIKADVSKREDVLGLLGSIAADFPPLRGIIHAAGTLDDGTLENLTWERFVGVLAPKVAGAWYLHELSSDLELDFFVCFSSIASLLGPAGQANHAAANGFLDALVHHRRAAGLPACGINWGAWSDVGAVGQRNDVAAHLQRHGLSLIPPATGIRCLEKLLSTNGQTVVVPADWSVAFKETGHPALLRDLASESRIQPAPPERSTRTPEPPPGAGSATRKSDKSAASIVEEALADVLGVDPSEIDPQRGFADLGVDSLLALDLRNRIQQELGPELQLRATDIFDHPNVEALSLHLAQLQHPGQPPLAAEEPGTISSEDAIAVVGMGCRFPGGAMGPEQFWRILQNGADCVREVLRDDGIHGLWKALNRKSGTPSVGQVFTEPVDLFDSEFFGVSPREARAMDPQQRMLLEVAWEALENAGIAADSLRGSQTGVFVGMMNNDYQELRNAIVPVNEQELYSVTGTGLSFAAGRLSHIVGLQGPSMVVDTACSSSLVAVHLACQSLREAGCHVALAGGANLMLQAESSIREWHMQTLSPSGLCRTFDAEADGFVRGEGCGMVVLKRLSDALADGDQVLAVIRGTAVNQDGPSSGLTVPNGPAQEAVITQALRAAGLTPPSIDYVEAHGTATQLGDPIELAALASSLGKGREPDRPLLVGSVKTNFGHLEAAAGIAGLIKTILALLHEEIPPHLHCRSLNPHFESDPLILRIPTKSTPWPESESGRRRAGVSSFGMSGSNAHLVIESAPPLSQKEQIVDRTHHLLCLSARDAAALRDVAHRYADFFESHPNISFANICHTAGIGRTHFKHRLTVIAPTSELATKQLHSFLEGDEGAGWAARASEGESRIGFFFGSDFSLPIQKARLLHQTSPGLRHILESCEKEWEEAGSASPLPAFLEADDNSQDPSRELAFLFQLAISELWQLWGVRPDSVLASRRNQWAGGAVAGILPRKDAIQCFLSGKNNIEVPETAPLVIIPENKATAVGPQTLSEHGCTLLIDPCSGSQPPSAESESKIWSGLLSCLAQVYLQGGRLDWRGVDEGYRRRRVALPTYPFHRERFWLVPSTEAPRRSAARATSRPLIHPLLGQQIPVALSERLCQCTLSPDNPSFLTDHRVHSECLLPAAAYLEMALAFAAMENLGPIQLTDVLFRRPLILKESEETLLQTILSGDVEEASTFKVLGRAEESGPDGWELHASGGIELSHETPSSEIDLFELQSRFNEKAELDGFYASCGRRGLSLGPVSAL